MVAPKKPTSTQLSHTLINKYVASFKAKYGYKPEMNRFKYKYGVESMIKDLGYERAQEVIEFYFRTERSHHPIDYLMYNYEKLDRFLKESDDDRLEREKIRADTKARVEEWMRTNGDK